MNCGLDCATTHSRAGSTKHSSCRYHNREDQDENVIWMNAIWLRRLAISDIGPRRLWRKNEVEYRHDRKEHRYENC